MNSATTERIQHWIKACEGFRAHAYRDHRGHRTIGYGHNLDAHGQDFETITLQQAEQRFQLDYRQACRIARRIEGYERLAPARQGALIHMAFQMGRAVDQFQAMIAWLQRGAFIEAAIEAMDSRWARQTPRRAKQVARVIAHGTLESIPQEPIAGLPPGRT